MNPKITELREQIQAWGAEVERNRSRVEGLHAEIDRLERRQSDLLRGRCRGGGLITLAINELTRLEAVDQILSLPCARDSRGGSIERFRITRVTPKRIYYKSIDNPQREWYHQQGSQGDTGISFEKTKEAFLEWQKLPLLSPGRMGLFRDLPEIGTLGNS